MDSSQRIIKKAQLFEFYSQKLWPLHRVFVKNKLSRRCAKCIVSEKQFTLYDGVCEKCHNYKILSRTNETDDSKMSDELSLAIRMYVGKGIGKYDAAILISGGKDSALLLHRLKRDFPSLRLLGVSVDNGFISPIAKSNIDFLLKKIPIDHIFVKPNLDFCTKTFRFALLNSRKLGGYEVVDRMAGDLLHDLGRNVAAQYGTPLLLTGMSRTQVQKIFQVFNWEMPAERESKARRESAGFSLDKIYSPIEMRQWWDPAKFASGNIHRLLFPFYAWNLNEQNIREEVTKLGLIPSGQDSPLVTNDALIPLMGVVDIVNLGYSSFEHEFAEMVRDGKADRKYWTNIYELLEYCGKTGFLLKKDIKAVLSDLQLNAKDLGITW